MNKQQHIKETSLIQRRFENKYFPKVKAVLQSEVDHVAGIVEHQGIDAAIKYCSEHIHSKGLPAIIQQLYIEVGSQFARRQWRIFLQQKRNARKSVSVSFQTKGFGFNAAWVKWIKDFLIQFLIEKITFQVAETTRKILLTVLNNAIEGGWGIDKTVRALDELPLSTTQAARIVRTEITRATNTGTFAAGATFDFEQTKEWIAAHDKRTRGQEKNPHASHVLLDGQTIDYDTHFIDPINADRLLFPGDPDASAASTINCRCSVALLAKVDEQGRLIPKKENVLV